MTEVERLVKITPSKRQLDIQKMEFYTFIHFGICTFTDTEWGTGDSDISLFNPDKLDVTQWVTAIKSSGARGIILTCKHHDGFCLWDTKYTDRNIMNSPYGKDLTLELAEECLRQGIKFGVYLSPWDRHQADYGKGKAYDDFYVAQIKELLTGYGEIFTVWLDGACGEGANGKVQKYDWERYYDVVRELQPNAVIAVTGPDIRWCGNEAGVCRESEFSVVAKRLSDPELIAGASQQTAQDAQRLLNAESARKITRKDGDLGSRKMLEGENELIWYPAEVDTSIRKGWYYHTADDENVKSDEALWNLYCNSVGGNATLLLNIPPDKNGLLHTTDCKRLENLGQRIRDTFSENLAKKATITVSGETHEHKAPNIISEDESYYKPNDGSENVEIIVQLDEVKSFSYVMLMEQITCSQRVEEFELWSGKKFIYKGTTIGYKKICRFDTVTTKELTVRILSSRIAPTIRFLGLY